MVLCTPLFPRVLLPRNTDAGAKTGNDGPRDWKDVSMFYTEPWNRQKWIWNTSTNTYGPATAVGMAVVVSKSPRAAHVTAPTTITILTMTTLLACGTSTCEEQLTWIVKQPRCDHHHRRRLVWVAMTWAMKSVTVRAVGARIDDGNGHETITAIVHTSQPAANSKQCHYNRYRD